jgi:sec-independent protein translocase protein TatB
MFDIGWGELVIIGIVALIAIGPKELPGALRTLGQWMGKVRRMASEFQNQFNEAMREAEMADLKKQVDTLTSGFDPIETARREFETAMEDKPAASTPAAGPAETTSAYVEPLPVETTVPGDPPSASDAVASAPVAPVESPPEKPAVATEEGVRVESAGGRPA